MATKHAWTENEIDVMKHSFLKGERIKLIARRLRRSPTAVNKALTRFRIRPCLLESPDNQRDKTKPSVISATPLFLKPERSRRKEVHGSRRVSSKQMRVRPIIVEEGKDHAWVSFENILEWLREDQDIPILNLYRRAHSLRGMNSWEFMVAGQPMTRSQVVMYANRLRHTQNQPIFLVDEVTWH